MSNTDTTQERNCAFQYAKISGRGFSNSTEIVCDKSSLTIDEAIALWNQYYGDCAKHIKEEYNTAEMVIWVDMEAPGSYGKHLHYISTDAESDGNRIWETRKEFFPKEIPATQPESSNYKLPGHDEITEALNNIKI